MRIHFITCVISPLSIPSQVSTWITLVGLLALIAVPSVEGLVLKDDLTVRGQLAQVDQFGFGPGGSSEISLRLDEVEDARGTTSPRYVLLDCTHTEFLAIPGRSPRLEQSTVCGRIQTNSTTGRTTCSGWSELTAGQTTTYSAEYDEKALHHFLIVNCGGTTLPVHAEYTLLASPSNHHLSLAEAPLPFIYSAIALIWISIAMKAFTNYRVTHTGMITSVHKALLVMTLMKTLSACAVAVHWAFCWVGPTCNVLAFRINVVSDALAQAALFTVVLAITRGWVVLYPKFSRTHWPVVGASAAAVAVALTLLRSLEADPALALALLYFFLLPYLYTMINDCTTRLEGHATLLGFVQEEIDPARPAALSSKLEVYEGFQSALVAYLMVLMLSNLIRLMVPWHMGWVTCILPEMAFVGAVMALTKTFSPTRIATSDAFTPIPFLPDTHLQTALSTLTASRFAAADAQARAAAAEARAAPSERESYVPAPVHPGQMVLVEHPAKEGEEAIFSIGTEESAWNAYKEALVQHSAMEAKRAQTQQASNGGNQGDDQQMDMSMLSPHIGGPLSPSGSSISSMSSLESLTISVTSISLTSPHVLANEGEVEEGVEMEVHPEAAGESTPRGWTPVATEEE